MEKVPLIETTPTTKKVLTELLKKHNIPIKKWGNKDAKTLDHLLEEINSGECVLYEDENSKLIRSTNVIGVEVIFVDKTGSVYRLVEDKQVFKDGRKRKRDLNVSVAEKIQTDEDPEQAAERAVQEELDIKSEINLIFIKKEDINRASNSYPGLKSCHQTYYYQLTLNHEQYDKNGYVEEQKDKTTYFVWVQVDTN